AAEKEIIVQTPYAIVGNKYYKLIRKIRKNSPNIRFRALTNSVAASDHIYAAGIALKQRRIQIEELQFEMHAAKPVPGDVRELVSRYDRLMQETASVQDPSRQGDPDLLDLDIEGPRFCVHSKSMVIDGSVSYVGSHNFDPRSFNLNTECGILIKDAAFSGHVRAIIEKTMNARNSWVIAAREYPPVMAELNSLITFITSNLPMFDVWPLEHVTCYELKDGCEPVPPTHEDFYHNYRDVGPLPGLDIGVKSVQAQLVRGFAGFASPLM
ncbi:MAG TPA: phospholipase D-like domain-containing protein, partial [Oceanipulchritudo sp.]|nr:phospholipase D-like domain-containing protein [Oceanipulchritudo sp.]